MLAFRNTEISAVRCFQQTGMFFRPSIRGHSIYALSAETHRRGQSAVSHCWLLYHVL